MSKQEVEEIQEKLLTKFVAQVSDIFDEKLKQSRVEYAVMLEQKVDEMGVYQDQINTIGSKIDNMDKKFENRFDALEAKVDNLENRIMEVEDDTKAIKNYLMDNLEPRVNTLESVTA